MSRDAVRDARWLSRQMSGRARAFTPIPVALATQRSPFVAAACTVGGMSRSARPSALIVVPLFALLGLLFTLQSYFQQITQGQPEPFWLLGRRQLTIWTVRAALAPLVFMWCEWRRPRTASWSRWAGWHLAAALTYGLGTALIIPTIEFALRWTPAPWTYERALRLNLLSLTPSNVLAYALAALAWHATTYYTTLRERETRAAQLEAELSQSRLQLLKNQLQPHFLFNTLNTVSGLMSDDVRAARTMLSRLAELLRASLDRFDEQEVRLADEIALVRQYLDIQQVRFGDRLSVTLAVNEDAAEGLVPSFLLQPVVENAIRHGVEAQSNRGEIVIAATVEDVDGLTTGGRRLRIDVRDSGPGLTDRAGRDHGGIGLGNTRARMRHLYGDDQSLELHNGDRGGLTVRIDLPFHAEPLGTGGRDE